MAVKVRQKSGKWWVFIDHKGKRKAKCIGDKRAAEQLKAKLDAKIALGEFEVEEDQERLSFSTYYKNWLETYVKNHTKAATYASYELAYRVHLLPFFGNTDIRHITRQQLKRLIYDKLNVRLSRNSLRGYLAPLREMFNHAIEDGILDSNPCLRVLRNTRQEEGERQEKISFLSREEVSTILDAYQEHFPTHYPFILLLVRTGLRLGEAVALQWGDIDFHGRFIEVSRSYCRTSRRLILTKSSRRRRVDMSHQLTETLKALHLERKKETLKKGWGEIPMWVFISEEGTMMDSDNFRRRLWEKLLSKIDFRHLRIHDLRHTFASLLIQQGESLAYVKEQMGHHSIQVTVDIYGHLVPGGNKAAVDRLDEPSASFATATARNLSATTADLAQAVGQAEIEKPLMIQGLS